MKLKRNVWFIGVISILSIFYSCFFSTSAIPAELVSNRTYLTTEILQEKLDNLIQQEGKDTIALNNYVIDLEKQEANFKELFYKLLKTKFNKRDRPIVLDLTNSLVRGDFNIDNLSLTTPIVESAFSGLLASEEIERLKDLDLIKNSNSTTIPNINVFRGYLKLDNTIFAGNVNFSQTWFLDKIVATSADFQQNFNGDRATFIREVNFDRASFHNETNFGNAGFLTSTQFQDTNFQGTSNFNRSYFQAGINFNRATFSQVADFTRSVFWQTTDFSQTIWRDRAIFSKSKFLAPVLFNNGTFENTVAFRDLYLDALISLNNVNLLNRIDFSNALFSSQGRLDFSGLAFDAETAKIIGDSGDIGKVIQVNSLEENKTTFRNLIRNFRSLEQINDANQIEYQREKLHIAQLGNLITATFWQQALSLTWLGYLLSWSCLSLLLLLGDYGTNINLVFSTGVIVLAFFSLIFWLVDRYRPNINSSIIPRRYEIIFMLGSYVSLTIFGIANTFITTDRPWLTLFCIATILFPLPLTLVALIYWRGRYHQLLNISYFVENGELRQFRLLLGRMPIIPRFPFYRDRYETILWDRRWGWLNYYDLSLNNIFKLGFNDIRLRDRHLPGIIATLVWYQWILGGLYIVLLLWTLSRTIPGLNLLIYF